MLEQVKLDILLLYLRRVHSYCFYCGEEFDDERMISTRCGPQHIRNAQLIEAEDIEEALKNLKKPEEGKEIEKETKTEEVINMEGELVVK